MHNLLPSKTTGRACSRPQAAARQSSCTCIARAPSHVDRAQKPSEAPCPAPAVATTRRAVGLALGALLPALIVDCQPASAGFQKELKKRKLSEDEYTLLDAAGLRIYELEEGSGPEAKEGDRVVVHYDCLFRGIDAVSSRSARLLGGNRTVAEPYQFVVGDPVYGVQARLTDSANGLFSGAGGPKPPQALSLGVMGMKKGGKRSLIVDKPELGYPRGMLEIPAGATFELKVEVLNVYPAKAT